MNLSEDTGDRRKNAPAEPFAVHRSAFVSLDHKPSTVNGAKRFA